MNDETNLYTDLNESILRSLFDSSPQGVVVVREGEIIYINNALRKSVGIQSKEGIPDNIDELRGILSSGFQEDAKDRYSSILSGHVSTHQGKFEFIKENGEKNYLDISSNAITVNGKKYIIAYSIDVTGDKIAKDALTRERKAYSIIAEAALSTESVENLCESILEGLVSTLGFDLGTIRLYDEGDESLHLKAIVGLDEGDTPKVVHRDDPDFLVARTARTLSPLFTSDIEKTGESHERMSRAKQLKVRSLIFWPIIGSEHNLLGVINIAAREPKSLGQGDRTVFATIAGMFSTILERRNAERELRDSQDRFIAFADNLPGPVYIKDDQSKVLFINRYMRDVAPKSNREDWEGKTNIDLFQAERAEMLTEEDHQVLRDGPVDRIQRTVSDGKIKTFRTHKFPIIREGKPPLIGGFSIDITEQVEAEKQREEARARAEFFNDLMAHDLNNMHQGIMSSLELILSDDGLQDNLRNIAENALKQVNRSVSLINNVKKFSTINREDLTLQKTDPAESLTAAVQIMYQSFPLQKITINSNLSSGKYCIMANEFLQDVFYNILHNAVKFTESTEARIDIKSSLTDKGEYLRVEFEDRGIGIDDRLKKSILTGFDERVRRVSGVGLTLVRQIVDQYKGKVWVEDRVEGEHSQGARVVVMLPNGC